jgi:hypothetical protein
MLRISATNSIDFLNPKLEKENEMAQGDIPVEGSAVVGGAFPLRAQPQPGQNPNDSILMVNSHGRPLRIFVSTGTGKTFNERITDPNWRLEIFEDTPANVARHPATSV